MPSSRNWIFIHWASKALSQRPRAALISPGGAAQALHLRLPEPHPVQPPPGARGPAQCRSDVAHRPPGAGLQDHRRLPATTTVQASVTFASRFVILSPRMTSTDAEGGGPSTGAVRLRRTDSNFVSIGPALARIARIKVSARRSDYRHIRRWEHEGVLERVQQRLDRKNR